MNLPPLKSRIVKHITRINCAWISLHADVVKHDSTVFETFQRRGDNNSAPVKGGGAVGHRGEIFHTKKTEGRFEKSKVGQTPEGKFLNQHFETMASKKSCFIFHRVSQLKWTWNLIQSQFLRSKMHLVG